MFMKLKTNLQISVKLNFVVLFRNMATCFVLKDHHQAIITKILQLRRNAVQIKLVI